MKAALPDSVGDMLQAGPCPSLAGLSSKMGSWMSSLERTTVLSGQDLVQMKVCVAQSQAGLGCEQPLA